VLLLHSFEYDQAIAAFREAREIDPAFAMAYWGEALSYSQPLWYHEDVTRARQTLSRFGATPAARLAKVPTARERGYFEAVEALFGAGERRARAAAYAARMDALSNQFPEDDEAAAFYALALLATIPQNARDPQISLRAGALAASILRRNPEHPGAAHYALHAYGDGDHARLGLEAARIYARIAPASSHARHMPSHVFLPLGMWDEAVRSDESAFAASVALAERAGLSSAQYDFHSLSWLHYEYLQQGRFTKARGMDDTVRLALDQQTVDGSRQPAHHAESEIGRGFNAQSLRSEAASMRARLVVESGSWTELATRGSFDNVDELFAIGFAAARLGDRARAEAAIQHLRRAREAAPDPENKRLADIMAGEVTGALLLAAGEKNRALDALAGAAAAEAAMPRPIARPYPIKPAVELYAEALLAAGDAAAAAERFRASLARTPRRAASLIGLARAQAASGDRAAAARTAREFLSMWHLADADRAELRDARTLAGGVQ
jgi:hypothetical protein